MASFFPLLLSRPWRVHFPRRLIASLQGWLIPIVLILIWEAIARFQIVPPNLLPAPSTVFITLVDLLKTGALFRHVGITLYRVAIGFFFGTVVATILGALTGYFRQAYHYLDPLLQALRNIPSIAWVPLFILWLGIGESPKISLIAVGVFFPVYLGLMSGIRNVDCKLIEVGQIYRLSQFDLIRRVFFPATLPDYFVGLRGGLSLGWMFVVAAELMGASQGLGFLLVDGQTTGRPAVIIGSIILFAILGQITDSSLLRISRYFLR